MATGFAFFTRRNKAQTVCLVATFPEQIYFQILLRRMTIFYFATDAIQVNAGNGPQWQVSIQTTDVLENTYEETRLLPDHTVRF